jgi:hypothetical protein
MRPRKLLAALVVGTSIALAAPAFADGTGMGAGGSHAFCTSPDRPLGLRQRQLCPLAREVDGCEGLVEACEAAFAPQKSAWFEQLVAWASPIATFLLYALVAGIALLIAIPVLEALRRNLRDRRGVAAVRRSPRARAELIEPEPRSTDEPTTADALLQLADGERATGELDRALGLYLAASLAALDGRGALRIRQDATNGEYVRSCAEAPSREGLREIVREVDASLFGGQRPTTGSVSRVAARAQAIVRATSTTLALLLVVLSTLSCAAPRKGADPAADDLPREVLRRDGYRVSALQTSLATLPIPIPGADEDTPIVLVDTEKVALEAETRAHLLRWIEAGGVLVVFGELESAGLRSLAPTRDLRVRPSDEQKELRARVARPSLASRTEGEPLAWLGGEPYAVKRQLGRGSLLAVANDDLFTNLGVLPRGNADALVALVHAVSDEEEEVRVAGAEDGVPPPSNPFAALARAGLAKGLWHALAASIILFLAVGLRQARSVRVARETRRAFAEHVEATGSLYARADANVHALAVYDRFVESRLREATLRGDELAILEALRRLSARAQARSESASTTSGTPPAAER